MKKSHLILIIVAAIIITGTVGRNLIIENALKGGVKALTGLKMRIDRVDVGVFSTKVALEGLELYNPKDFPDKVMINMPELYVDYDLGQMLKKKVHLYELRIYLKEFVVIKNKDGKLNLDSLKVVKDTKKEAGQEKKPKPDGSFQIDVMALKIDKVIFKDYTAGAKPKVTEYPVKINEKFTNINDPKKVAGVIIVKALMNTAISRLTNFDTNALASNAADILRDATKIVGATAGAALDTGKEAAKTATETTKQMGDKAVDAASDTVDKTKEAIGKIFPIGGKREGEEEEKK